MIKYLKFHQNSIFPALSNPYTPPPVLLLVWESSFTWRLKHFFFILLISVSYISRASIFSFPISHFLSYHITSFLYIFFLFPFILFPFPLTSPYSVLHPTYFPSIFLLFRLPPPSHFLSTLPLSPPGCGV